MRIHYLPPGISPIGDAKPGPLRRTPARNGGSIPNLWMLRTYGKQYDPWQRPIAVGMEEPWLVRPEHHREMDDGDLAMLYIMDPRTAFDRPSKGVFAFGEIRVRPAPASAGHDPTPASAVFERDPPRAKEPVRISVRYTRVLTRPTGFTTMDRAIPITPFTDRLPRCAGRWCRRAAPGGVRRGPAGTGRAHLMPSSGHRTRVPQCAGGGRATSTAVTARTAMAKASSTPPDLRIRPAPASSPRPG
jgi:hypothetical protein